MPPDLDSWLPSPTLRIAHGRESAAPQERLWEAAGQVRLADAGRLGRLIRWRIPGTPAQITFDELFRKPPFIALRDEDGEPALVSGLVGRIWTLRRDYPLLESPDQFRDWSQRGTARVLFANWVQAAPSGRSALRSEVRVEVFGVQGRVGLTAVRPLIGAFHQLVATDGIEAAVRLAERQER
jgi:hypothetical protein